MPDTKKSAKKPTAHAKPAAARVAKAKTSTHAGEAHPGAAEQSAKVSAVEKIDVPTPKAQNRFSAARKSRIAQVLRGKHKPMYTPHADAGDYVVVINAEKVKLTGTKEEKKPYYRHSLHPGGLKTTLARDIRARTPELLIERAVRLMIPRNPLGREVMRKLKIYVGPVHPHQAQDPKPLKLDL
jgi:large subunit ribosomal protein L13